MDTVAGLAEREMDRFRGRVARLPYERKGILYSEMFFFYICARTVAPRRILESGRARGQSTLLLASTFPDLPIVSMEYDRESPDIAVAAERLAGLRNVELRFGDATRLLPEIARPGDIALIDGPKGFRALRLALALLVQGTVEMVFLHDVGRESPERRFLERHLPTTLYSDDPRFARLAHVLDERAAADIPTGHRWEGNNAPLGYGFTLACLRHEPNVAYRRLLVGAALAGTFHRLRHSQ